MAASADQLSPIQRQFQKSYYPPHGTPWPPLRYHGVPCAKIAPDLWALGELVWELRPGLIIETGTAAGGTALFLADQLDAIGHGQVLTIDVAPCAVAHARMWFEQGASTLGRLQARAAAAAHRVAAEGGAVVVILDSDHRAPHVAAELAAYAPLVTVGSLLLIEDTNLGTPGAMPAHGPGPAVALAAYLTNHPGEWEAATEWEPPLTTNPGGWLRRIQACAHG